MSTGLTVPNGASAYSILHSESVEHQEERRRGNDQHGMGVVLVERLGRCFRPWRKAQGWHPSHEEESAIPVAVVLWDES